MEHKKALKIYALTMKSACKQQPVDRWKPAVSESRTALQVISRCLLIEDESIGYQYDFMIRLQMQLLHFCLLGGHLI